METTEHSYMFEIEPHADGWRLTLMVDGDQVGECRYSLDADGYDAALEAGQDWINSRELAMAIIVSLRQ